MDIHARLGFIRIAPRKVRLVAKELRGLSIKQAISTLQFLPQRSSGPLLKLLQSAVANAKHNFELDADKLFVREVRVGGGTKLKRFMPRSKGAAFRIEKKTSHIDMFLAEREPSKKKIEGKKSEIVRRKIEDLSAEDLAVKKEKTSTETEANSTGAVKKAASPKSSRQAFQRRAGEG